MSTKWTVQDSDEFYRVSMWGGGYFQIHESGNLHVFPTGEGSAGSIDISAVVKEALEQGVSLPMVLRFQDVLKSQVVLLNTSFEKVISELNYKGTFLGV